jgi:uncharacterized protein
MSIEYLPVGIACNLKCSYCYQEPMRQAGNINSPIDWSGARKTLEKHNHKFTVFGGEPLLAPISHLEEVWKFGLEKFQSNTLQTNGVLITDEHIRLFKNYKVSVGISVDGSKELNDARWMGDEQSTREATEQIHTNIKKLVAAGVVPSLIVTLHRKNASEEKLPSLIQWLKHLETIGIRHINFHILEVEKGEGALALSQEENTLAFLSIYEFGKTTKLQMQPFVDIYKLLTEESAQVSCIWNHCDPLTTAAVQGVNPDGSESNCGRTNKDGVNWVKADRPGLERYLILYNTPQEHGGCQDCRFFVFCKGQCPGTAMGGDWRNRTVDCQTWFALFTRIEYDIILSRRLPITRQSMLMGKMIARFIGDCENSLGQSSSMHSDSPHGDAHGDSPHQDIHGDSDSVRAGGVEVSWR